jgi:uncharacterized protein YqeY
MSIKEQLKLDLTEAIRSRNEIVSGTIRMVLTAITNEEVAGKEARQLTEADIAAMIAEAIAATGAAGPADMGKVMGAIKAKIAGKADGSVVSSLVKAALNK